MTGPPFNEYLGTRLVERGKGEAVLAIDLEPHHLNLRGVAHGGVVSSLLDSALGLAVISGMPVEWWCATTSLNVQFVGGGRGTLTARGRLVRRTSHVAFATGEIVDDRDRIVATASGTWHLWPHRPGAVEAPPPARHLVLRDGSRIRVGKIVAVGRNYADHVREMQAPPDGDPVLFLKPPSALLHGDSTVVLPGGVGEVHHEVELVVVIGKAGKAIPVASAHEHVLGYALGLDLTLRDLQSEAKKRGEPWSVSKGFDGSAPISTVAPRDDVGDGSGLEIELQVNGETRQRGNTSQMLYPVPELIHRASRFMTLERGDLLFTGTPAGVGPLRHGDRVHATLENVGSLELKVATEDPDADVAI